jgi:hypothetical protein
VQLVTIRDWFVTLYTNDERFRVQSSPIAMLTYRPAVYCIYHGDGPNPIYKKRLLRRVDNLEVLGGSQPDWNNKLLINMKSLSERNLIDYDMDRSR